MSQTKAQLVEGLNINTSAPADALVINSSGNVGIGTSSPLALYRSLSIHGPANDEGGVLDLATANQSSRAYVFNDSNGLSLQTSTSHPILLKTNNSERLRIDSSGNVGIGTASPNSLLDCAGGNITLTEDTNLIFKNSARSTNRGAIQFTSGGEFRVRYGSLLTEGLRIDSSGRLLVGTSSDTTGDTGAKIQIVDSGTPVLALSRNDTSIVSGNTLGQIRIFSNDDSGYQECARIAAQADGTFANNDKPTRLVFSTTADSASSPTERMRIDSAGRVGIGTTSPQRPLHVNGTEGVLRLTSTASGNNGFEVGVGTASQAFLWNAENSHIEIATNNTERMRIDSSGKVLVATTSPSNYADRQLTVGDTSLSSSNIEIRCASNGFGGLTFSDSTASDVNSYRGTIEYGHSTNHMQFRTDAVERMRIDSSGRVGIGTTSMSSFSTYGNKLVVHGTGTDGPGITISTGTGDTASLFFADGTSGAETHRGSVAYAHSIDSLIFGTASTTRMSITSTGRIQANTSTQEFGEKYLFHNDEGTSCFTINQESTAAHTGLLIRHARGGLSGFTAAAVSFRGNDSTEEGSITIGVSSVSYNTSSDYRLKENQQNIDDGIERVKRLSPYRFNFIKDPNSTVDGFFAHEAQTVVPEAVTGTHNEVDDDGNAVMQGIDQSKLVPLLTAALQETIAKIETLETQNADLLSRVTALEG